MKKLLFIAAFLGLTFAARGQDAVFIVHPDLNEGTLTAENVKHILLGNKTKWPHGSVIKLVVLTEGAVLEKVIKDYTQRTPDQFDKFWKKQVFTGVGTMPAQAKTDAEVIAYVAANPGAIGFIAKESVTDKVKVIPVN